MAPPFFCAMIEFSQQSHQIAVSIPILQNRNLKTEGGRHLHIRWGLEKYVQKTGYRCYAFGVSSEVFVRETQRREDTSLRSLPRETELAPESRSLGSRASVPSIPRVFLGHRLLLPCPHIDPPQPTFRDWPGLAQQSYFFHFLAG